MAVPWDVINSGLVLDDELADPRRLAEVRTAYDPHLALGLEQDATAEAVRTAFRSLARQHHPDRGGDVVQFQRIQAAHDALVGVGSDAGSVLLFGGGIRKGHLHGVTADERPCSTVKDPVVIEDLHATLYKAMGISPRLAYEVEQRPFYVTRDGLGKPIQSLFG